MSLPKRRKSRTFALLACLITFTTFLFSYTFRDPSLYFFKYAFRLSDTSRGFCACEQCMTALEDDPWFTERFNLSIQPLMTRENSALSDETFKWWQLETHQKTKEPRRMELEVIQQCALSGASLALFNRFHLKWPRRLTEALLCHQWLQAEKQPANFSEVVDELFQVIPDELLYMDASPDRCRTCAVVGNSGNLKGSQYGGIIDSSHFIIRMNQAPTSGFEEDVGARTTHHVMYPESAIDLDNSTSLVLIPFKTLDLQWIISALTTGSIKQTYIPVIPRIKANKDKVFIYSPTFFKYVYESWLEGHGRYPSTGFLSLLLAIHICDEVSVFGFGADQYGNWHHYWEDNHLAGAFRHTGVHDGDYEYNVTLLLADKHKIRIFKGR